MAQFTFGQVEAVLAAINHVADDKRVAFAGRLKFLQKNGVPMRTAPGRGKSGNYSFENLVQLAVAVELLQCGLTPQRASEIVKLNWWLKLDEVLSVLLRWRDISSAKAIARERAEPLDPSYRELAPWIWKVRVQALSESLGSPDRSLDASALVVESRNDMRRFLDWKGDLLPRAIYINAGYLVGSLIAATCRHFSFATLDDLIIDLADLEPELEEAARRFHRQMEDGERVFSTDETVRNLAKEKAAEAQSSANVSVGEFRALVRLINVCVTEEEAHEISLLNAELNQNSRLMQKLTKPFDQRRQARNELATLHVLGPSDESEEPDGLALTEFGRRYINAATAFSDPSDVDPKA